ncbi:unnamed protein product, partial [Brassica oleracea var. botrytis]
VSLERGRGRDCPEAYRRHQLFCRSRVCFIVVLGQICDGGLPERERHCLSSTGLSPPLLSPVSLSSVAVAASLPPADWSFCLLRPSSFRRKPSAVACLSDALQPILLCGTSVMGPELSRITFASISMSLTCSSSHGLFVLGGTHMDTPCRLLEWTTSRVDFTGSRWPDQGLVSLASPVAPVGVASGMVCGSLDHSPVESSIDLCCLMQVPASCLFRDLLKLNVCSWYLQLLSFGHIL